jgi:hypothetical protein
MIISNYGVVVQAFYICHLQPIKLSKYIKLVEIVTIQVLGFIEDEWTFNIASFMKNMLQLNHPSMHLDMCTKFYSLHFFQFVGFPLWPSHCQMARQKFNIA